MEDVQLTNQARFIRFALVGLSGTIVDFAIFNILSSLLGLQVIISSIFSFILAVINNFYWNRNWTYPESKKRSFSEQLSKFFLVSMAGLLIRTPLFAIIEKPLIILFEDIFDKQFFITPVVAGHNIALAVVIIIVLFWNYFINKIWTYKGIE